MTWTITYLEEAEKDLTLLDHSQRLMVLKAVRKVAANPLPASEGGLGKPLGNRSSANLKNFCKIKLTRIGIRVVYKPTKVGKVMKIIVVGARADDAVYKLAEKRIQKHRDELL